MITGCEDIELAEYLLLAEQVTAVEAAALAKSSRVDLADSALQRRPLASSIEASPPN